MPDDHSVSVPPLPIPNRTVKRLHADDSADSRVKVGNRQAPQQQTETPPPNRWGFCVYATETRDAQAASRRRITPTHRGRRSLARPRIPL